MRWLITICFFLIGCDGMIKVDGKIDGRDILETAVDVYGSMGEYYVCEACVNNPHVSCDEELLHDCVKDVRKIFPGADIPWYPELRRMYLVKAMENPGPYSDTPIPSNEEDASSDEERRVIHRKKPLPPTPHEWDC